MNQSALDFQGLYCKTSQVRSMVFKLKKQGESKCSSLQCSWLDFVLFSNYLGHIHNSSAYVDKGGMYQWQT